jgi:hypothetical protein
MLSSKQGKREITPCIWVHPDDDRRRWRSSSDPCLWIVAVTLPPALDSAIMVSRIAATGVMNAA